METVLIEGWLDDDAGAIPVLDVASVSEVRDRVREEAARVGLPPETAAKMVNVASELATNQLSHARAGAIAVVPIARGGVAGLEVRSADRGPGIYDPAKALRGGASTAGTLGVGLSAVFELAREVDVDVRIGEGTCVCARAFAADVPRWREVGVFARPCEGERVSGDGALVRRTKRGLVAVAIDGLGHGDGAREATMAAVRAARGAIDAGPEAILQASHAAIGRTRGVAMTIAEIDDAGGLTLAGVGNVIAYIVGPHRGSRFSGSAGVVGAPGPLRRIALERAQLSPYDAVLLCSDGLTSRTSLDDDRALLSEAPIVIAQRTLQRFARDNDDAIVVALR